MTAQTRATNISRFEQGDIPQGTDFADLIDSYVSLSDTTAQVLSSDLKANNFSTSGEVSAATISASILNIAALSAANLLVSNLTVAASAQMSGTLNVAGAIVTASSMWVTGRLTLTGVSGDLVFGTSAAGVTATVTASSGIALPHGGNSQLRARGLIRVTVEGTVAYLPFFYAT